MENTPAKRALAVLDTPPPTEPLNKALRITNRVRRAIDLMVSGAAKKYRRAPNKSGFITTAFPAL